MHADRYFVYFISHVVAAANRKNHVAYMCGASVAVEISNMKIIYSHISNGRLLPMGVACREG